MILDEGRLRFTFPGEKAIKFDDTRFYKKRFNKFSGSKGVDFICDTNDFLLFLEVKDCLGREVENHWRIEINNGRVETAPTTVDTNGRESLDNEMVHKVTMTLSCLLGAKTFSESREDAEILVPYAEALEDEKIARQSKKLFVVLLLEGDFNSNSRSKKMQMTRIQESVEKKLKWLNCRVSVVDLDTYRERIFRVERITD